MEQSHSREAEPVLT